MKIVIALILCTLSFTSFASCNVLNFLSKDENGSGMILYPSPDKLNTLRLEIYTDKNSTWKKGEIELLVNYESYTFKYPKNTSPKELALVIAKRLIEDNYKVSLRFLKTPYDVSFYWESTFGSLPNLKDIGPTWRVEIVINQEN